MQCGEHPDFGEGCDGPDAGTSRAARDSQKFYKTANDTAGCWRQGFECVKACSGDTTLNEWGVCVKKKPVAAVEDQWTAASNRLGDGTNNVLVSPI
jgi:hypothetical protein